MPLKKAFVSAFSLNSSPSGKERPLHVVALKCGLMGAVLLIFLTSLILVCIGPSILDPYISSEKTDQQANCLKNTWMIFLVLNMVFCLVGFIGFAFEKITCAFFFTIYSFFVAFGIFFDTISKNHWFWFLSMPVTISSLLFLVIMRIERLDPPPAPRKYSIYTNVAGKV